MPYTYKLVLGALSSHDVRLYQLTSQATSDEYLVPLDTSDFVSGGLKLRNRIRPNRLFTADSHVMLFATGRVSDSKLNEVINAVIKILK